MPAGQTLNLPDTTMKNIWNTPSNWTAEDEARLEAKRALAAQRQATWEATHPQAEDDEDDEDDERASLVDRAVQAARDEGIEPDDTFTRGTWDKIVFDPELYPSAPYRSVGGLGDGWRHGFATLAEAKAYCGVSAAIPDWVHHKA